MQKCSLKGKNCRHCSHEQNVTIQRVQVIKTGAMESKEVRIKLGEFCNNDGTAFVRDLKECPADIALGVKITPEMYYPSELDWMRRRS